MFYYFRYEDIFKLCLFRKSPKIQKGTYGDIHKPRGQLRGEGGVSQMTILLHKPYLAKVTTKGGVKNAQKKFDHVVYG